VRTPKRVRARAHTRTHTHAHAHTRAHTHTRTHAHTHTHTHTHTRRHAHTQHSTAPVRSCSDRQKRVCLIPKSPSLIHRIPFGANNAGGIRASAAARTRERACKVAPRGETRAGERAQGPPSSRVVDRDAREGNLSSQQAPREEENGAPRCVFFFCLHPYVPTLLASMGTSKSTHSTRPSLASSCARADGSFSGGTA
jgi:hypothetical protein